jgi:hypothetical protein
MIYPDVAGMYIGQPQERGRAAAGRRQGGGRQRVWLGGQGGKE